MLPWAVRDQSSGKIVGSTRFHDIVASIDRVEIGYTWYSKSHQRTRINTSCKLLLLQYAFESIGCKVVGWRTDNFNFQSQRAIEGLGAKKRWRVTSPSHASGRLCSRYRDVQHVGRRMAGCKAAPGAAPGASRNAGARVDTLGLMS